MPVEVETRDLGRSPFRIGDWLIEPSLNRLSKGDTTIQLELKVMDVLVCLAGRAGEVVPRQEIVDRVWATEFISDNTLTHAITELRNALGDDARNPSFIETIHRRGYRLIAPVTAEGLPTATVTSFPSQKAVAVEEERSPYPGLAAFTEADAEFFFGREDEVAKMWRKLTSRRLLAVIGPSGVGKSSFLRAGVIPAKPDGWGVLVCQPGEAPFAALARALVPEFAGDIEATAQLVDIRDGDRAVAMVSRWRDRYGQALLILDQFEELFTLNPSEIQTGFSEFLRRLVDDADVHVLLAMRDDFLFHVHGYPALAPILDELTLLGAPAPDSLRLALVEPARRLGFAFENENLPGEMIAVVEGERGALPMLAFAVARLWDERDRNRHLLTDQAYEDIGGVGGALGQHAEATLRAIGDERLPIVREVFRNLVTAEGTRAVREWNELLSVFGSQDVGAGLTPARQAAEDVLRRLIDARLLTSFEEEDVEGDGRRRVEVVHESLLSSWPRLVRWQTQDADAAQLRDQLRQAARTWEEHERTDDFLWTGKAYREFDVWKENYPGGLSELEDAFAAAMSHHARRRKRRRRILAASALVLATVVAAVFGTLWRRSVHETRRAEASKLLALAQLQLEADPTEALAYATTSLKVLDTGEARFFVMKALWAAPPARVMPAEFQAVESPEFSPDGRWLAASGHHEEVLVWPETGGDPTRLPGHTVSPQDGNDASWFSSRFLVTGHWTDQRARIWSMPEGQLIRTIHFGDPARWQVGENYLLVKVMPPVREGEPEVVHLKRWRLTDGEIEDLGSVDFDALGWTNSVFDPSGRGWIYAKEKTIFYRPLPVRDGVNDLVLGRHENEAILVPPRLDEPGRIWSRDRSTGEMRCWSLAGQSPEPLAVIPPPPGDGRYFVRGVDGRWWVSPRGVGEGKAPELWYLDAAVGARTIPLRRNDSWFGSYSMAVHAERTWMATPAGRWDKLVFWPLVKDYPVVVDVARGFTGGCKPFAFSPDGALVVVPWGESSLRLLSLPPTTFPGVRDLDVPIADSKAMGPLVFDSAGKRLLTTGFGTDVWVVPVNGAEAHRLEGFSRNHLVEAAAFSPSGRLVAVGSYYGTAEPKVLRVWDLETGEVRVFDLEPPGSEVAGTSAAETGYEHGMARLVFADESTLFSSGRNGVRRWDLETGAVKVIALTAPGTSAFSSISADRRTMLTIAGLARVPSPNITTVLHDLDTGASRDVDLNLAPGWRGLAIGPAMEIVVQACVDGSVLVGKIDERKRHLLLGHDGPVVRVAVSPDRAWIASAGEDETLRLWPMPDLSKPPLHTLPHDELIAKLKTLTNLRVVRDEESSTGWKLEVGPFPGWETVPTW